MQAVDQVLDQKSQALCENLRLFVNSLRFFCCL